MNKRQHDSIDLCDSRKKIKNDIFRLKYMLKKCLDILNPHNIKVKISSKFQYRQSTIINYLYLIICKYQFNPHLLNQITAYGIIYNNQFITVLYLVREQ